MFDQSHIRQLFRITHIDHGKSRGDRLLEKSATPCRSEMENQLLDNMDLE